MGGAGRRLVLIPESDLNDPRLLWPPEHGRFSLDAQWSDDFHHELHAVLTRERDGYYGGFGRMADLVKALHNGYVYDGQYSEVRQRCHGRPPVGLDGHRVPLSEGERSVLLSSHGSVGVDRSSIAMPPNSVAILRRR